MSRHANEVDAIIARNLKVLRRKHSMSQADVADAIGVTYQQVQKYEYATNRVSAAVLFSLSKLFGVSADAFYREVRP